MAERVVPLKLLATSVRTDRQVGDEAHFPFLETRLAIPKEKELVVSVNW